MNFLCFSLATSSEEECRAFGASRGKRGRADSLSSAFLHQSAVPFLDGCAPRRPLHRLPSPSRCLCPVQTELRARGGARPYTPLPACRVPVIDRAKQKLGQPCSRVPFRRCCSEAEATWEVEVGAQPSLKQVLGEVDVPVGGWAGVLAWPDRVKSQPGRLSVWSKFEEEEGS